MRLVNTKAHAVYDYVLCLVLISAPWSFGYATSSQAHRFTLGVAVLVALMALCTNFEFSFLKVVPLRAHLWLDLAVGLLLAGSPWLFHFSDQSYKPQLVFGLSIAFVSVLTDRLPASEALQKMGKHHHGSKQTSAQKQTKKDDIQTTNFPGLKFIYDTDTWIQAVKKQIARI